MYIGGNEARSLCSLVCKWNYEIGGDGKEIGWNKDFLELIGLGDLTSGDIGRLGTVVRREFSTVLISTKSGFDSI